MLCRCNETTFQTKPPQIASSYLYLSFFLALICIDQAFSFPSFPARIPIPIRNVVDAETGSSNSVGWENDSFAVLK